MRELDKYTSKNHPDSCHIQSVLEKLQSITRALNDSKKLKEDKEKMEVIMKSLRDVDSHVIEHRQYVHEGDLKATPLESPRKSLQRAASNIWTGGHNDEKELRGDLHMFLFADMLICAKKLPMQGWNLFK
eukprot:TRINITY_DN3644_c0_g1_i10.p2 TRINITY_DN3644_c0_g1~~TRINITY_DN3644_c0_g1_i10.p2  ORF type:complete len:130 (-),score=38.78 TRINITY_DN3644_c0_g1_i10:518-907(-)